MPKTATFRN